MAKVIINGTEFNIPDDKVEEFEDKVNEVMMNGGKFTIEFPDFNMVYYLSCRSGPSQ